MAGKARGLLRAFCPHFLPAMSLACLFSGRSASLWCGGCCSLSAVPMVRVSCVLPLVALYWVGCGPGGEGCMDLTFYLAYFFSVSLTCVMLVPTAHILILFYVKSYLFCFEL